MEGKKDERKLMEMKMKQKNKQKDNRVSTISVECVKHWSIGGRSQNSHKGRERRSSLRSLHDG
jgi:hypothetical protein